MAAVPRLCVSLPVHEQPAVILDQVENLRAFLGPQTQVVVHLSASMGLDPAAVQPLLPDGVHANPVSYETAWGDVGYVHLSNLRFAYDHLDPFDYVVLQASNDLYVRAGAPAQIARHQAAYGYIEVGPDTAWAQGPPALRDRQLAAIVADLGPDGRILGGQVEGSYYAADLFREVLERIDRHYTGPGEGERYVREEVYFPTVADALLTGPRGNQLIYADSLTRGPAVSPAVVYALREGMLAGAWTQESLFGVKRVPRVLHDPVRDLVRAIARTEGAAPRLAVPRPFAAKTLLVATPAEDVLTDPTLIPAWHATFTAQDDATLVIVMRPENAWELDLLVRVVQDGGTGAADAADVVLDIQAEGSFAEASLRHNAHAVLRPRGQGTPPVLDDALLFATDQADELRYVLAKRTGAPRPQPRG
jgi:hypothetical protein